MPRVIEHNEKGRICNLCKRFLEWKKFSKSADGANGHRSQCRDCVALKHKNRVKTRKLRDIEAAEERLKSQYVDAFIIHRMHLRGGFACH